jgi:hypothetical protein
MDLTKFEKSLRQMAREAMQHGDAIYNSMDPRSRQAGQTDEEAEALYKLSKALFIQADMESAS